MEEQMDENRFNLIVVGATPLGVGFALGYASEGKGVLVLGPLEGTASLPRGITHIADAEVVSISARPATDAERAKGWGDPRNLGPAFGDVVTDRIIDSVAIADGRTFQASLFLDATSNQALMAQLAKDAAEHPCDVQGRRVRDNCLFRQEAEESPENKARWQTVLGLGRAEASAARGE